MKKRYVVFFPITILLLLLSRCRIGKITPQQRETISELSPFVRQPQELQDEENPVLPSPKEEPKKTLPTPEIPSDEQFVKVTDYIPTIVIDLKYATTDNFTETTIYTFSEAYLRYGTVKKLSEVQKELELQGLGLKIWDAFRPVSAQFQLWEVCPNPTYVANPNNGFSSHSRGNTIDVTLVDSNGKEVEMPTGFDDFTNQADRNYDDCSKTARENAILLENVMIAHKFNPYQGEWWHFSDQIQYEVEYEFEPKTPDNKTDKDAIK